MFGWGSYSNTVTIIAAGPPSQPASVVVSLSNLNVKI
jgi:hypothetical protein